MQGHKISSCTSLMFRSNFPSFPQSPLAMPSALWLEDGILSIIELSDDVERRTGSQVGDHVINVTPASSELESDRS